MATGVKRVEGGDRLDRRHGEITEMMGMFCTLIGVMVTQVYTFSRTLRTKKMCILLYVNCTSIKKFSKIQSFYLFKSPFEFLRWRALSSQRAYTLLFKEMPVNSRVSSFTFLSLFVCLLLNRKALYFYSSSLCSFIILYDLKVMKNFNLSYLFHVWLHWPIISNTMEWKW